MTSVTIIDPSCDRRNIIMQHIWPPTKIFDTKRESSFRSVWQKLPRASLETDVAVFPLPSPHSRVGRLDPRSTGTPPLCDASASRSILTYLTGSSARSASMVCVGFHRCSKRHGCAKRTRENSAIILVQPQDGERNQTDWNAYIFVPSWQPNLSMRGNRSNWIFGNEWYNAIHSFIQRIWSHMSDDCPHGNENIYLCWSEDWRPRRKHCRSQERRFPWLHWVYVGY